MFISILGKSGKTLLLNTDQIESIEQAGEGPNYHTRITTLSGRKIDSSLSQLDIEKVLDKTRDEDRVHLGDVLSHYFSSALARQRLLG